MYVSGYYMHMWVRYFMWVLGTEFGPSARINCTFNHRATSAALQLTILNCIMAKDYAPSSHTCFSGIFLTQERNSILYHHFFLIFLPRFGLSSSTFCLCRAGCLKGFKHMESHSMWFLMLGFPHSVVFRFHLCCGMSQFFSQEWRISPTVVFFISQGW